MRSNLVQCLQKLKNEEKVDNVVKATNVCIFFNPITSDTNVTTNRCQVCAVFATCNYGAKANIIYQAKICV